MINSIRSTVGEERLTVTLERRSAGDVVVTHWSCQRWFATEAECVQTLELVIQDLAALVNGRRSDHYAILAEWAAKRAEAEAAAEAAEELARHRQSEADASAGKSG